MFAHLFYYKDKFKPLIYTNVNVQDITKDKLSEAIKLCEEKRLQYLNNLDSKFKSSLLILSFTILIFALINIPVVQPYFNSLKQFIDNKLNLYHLWWENLPKFISFFLPSEIIYWIPSSISLLIISIIFLTLRTLIPVFQYRNNHEIKINLLELIFGNYADNFRIVHSNNITQLKDFYKILSLPSYDNILISDASVEGYLNSYNFSFHEINFSLNDEIATYRPKKTALQAMYLNLELDFKIENFVLYFNNIKDIISPTYLENKEIINLNNLEIQFCQKDSFYTESKIKNIYSIVYDYFEIIKKLDSIKEKKFIDNKIVDFLSKKPKNQFSNLTQTLQLGVFENRLYILVPCNREIFEKKSLFTKSILKEDIELLMSFLELTLKITEVLKIS